MDKTGKFQEENQITPESLSSCFQGSRMALLLYDGKSLTCLHTPPHFSLPLHLSHRAEKLLTHLNENHHADSWEFLDFAWDLNLTLLPEFDNQKWHLLFSFRSLGKLYRLYCPFSILYHTNLYQLLFYHIHLYIKLFSPFSFINFI